jgi:DNA helicase-2/ATP-dependent DNA helicase PcrA
MVLVDEYQDMNKAQAEFILKTIKGYPKNKKQGRLILLGDKNQNLYEFRGSNSSMHDEFKQKLKATVLPLSITYRCPKLIVKEANKIVPELQCAPNAIDGKISYISEQELKNIAKPGCFILSRVNAPLIGLALYFISNGIPANIQGRDLGKNLLSLIKKSKKKKMDSFLEYLEKWKEKEVTRLVKMERDTSHIYDKYDCFIALSESVNTIDELKNSIEKLFADTNEYNKIVLSSVHRSKGKERNTVFLLKKTFRFNTQSEKNIYYVATTRSKSELYLVS